MNPQAHSMAISNLDDLVLSKAQAGLKGRRLGLGIEKICQFVGRCANGSRGLGIRQTFAELFT